MVVKSKPHPRLYVGIDDCGDFSLVLSKGLRELGLHVTNVSFERKSGAWRHVNPMYDRVIEQPGRTRGTLNLLREFTRAIPNHDVFVLVNGGSFFARFMHFPLLRHMAYADLVALKALGKKLVVVTNGSDIRSPQLYVEELRRAGIPYSYYMDTDAEYLRGDRFKRLRAKQIEKFATKVFSFPLDALLLTKPYERAWVPIDLDEVHFCNDVEGLPLVVHAPSSRFTKGSEYVFNAVKELQTEGYEFNFRLCENLSNLELRRLLQRTHIVIDQFEPMYGQLGVEAMASGCVLMGGAIAGYHWPSDLPIVTSTPETLKAHLRDLVTQPSRRQELGLLGRAYVEKYHDYRVVARKFAEALGLLG